MAADSSQGSTSGGLAVGKYPVSSAFGLLVLAALAGLIILRHFTGTISISAG